MCHPLSCQNDWCLHSTSLASLINFGARRRRLHAPRQLRVSASERLTGSLPEPLSASRSGVLRSPAARPPGLCQYSATRCNLRRAYEQDGPGDLEASGRQAKAQEGEPKIHRKGLGCLIPPACVKRHVLCIGIKENRTPGRRASQL